jgi:hypothetical protein
MREIDLTPNSVRHLIVVTSCVDNVLATWVEAGWRVFINEKRPGRKTENVITLVTAGMAPGELPMSLRYYEVIPLHGSCGDGLLGYLK